MNHPLLALKVKLLRHASKLAVKNNGSRIANYYRFHLLTIMMNGNRLTMQRVEPAEVVASYIDHETTLNAARPKPEWQRANPVIFSSDWQGNYADPARQTQVRILWSERNLYLRFECHYRELYVFGDSESNGRRDHLWDRDS
jgi:hypothetical protein